ncbi:helix-turn-helix transcriptional regulator [bacterium]|nr:helix-turn-helix transcriptional regulator [bacterium]
MKLTKKFGKRLKEIRKRRNISQEELAELIGMEPNNISKLESGGHLPKKENLEKLCDVLEIEPKELFDFGHLKSKNELIEELIAAINKFSLKDLQYLKKIIDAYIETK